MIRSLSGKVLDILENIIILDVSGIGFEILCSRSVLNSCEV
ncbi:MAG: Holliday junction branch migration protein RuvA, partial [Synergistaceae bacterium]|nr:Holliday junction branch migration protein RuvA [Synergistaceae bacterium]